MRLQLFIRGALDRIEPDFRARMACVTTSVPVSCQGGQFDLDTGVPGSAAQGHHDVFGGAHAQGRLTRKSCRRTGVQPIRLALPPRQSSSTRSNRSVFSYCAS